MKTSRIVHFATLALVVGFVALACAAQDRPSNDKDHPKQDSKQVRPEQQHTQQPRSSADKQPSGQQEQRGNQSPHQTEQSRPAAHQQNRATTKQEHTSASHGATHPQQDRGRAVQQAAWQQHSASNWQSDHRTWQQRGGYHGYRIPDTRYRGHFGPGHAFLIRGRPLMVVGGFPRFQYNGYWLSVVDPWPQQWGNDWYDNDQVYVDYADGGYYLYNRSYPGIGIAVSISM